MLFSDGIPLYDRTATKCVKIVPKKTMNLLDGKITTQADEIYLGEGKILFNPNLNFTLTFSRIAFTKSVAVEDTTQQGVYKIIEMQTNGLPVNTWCVDTNKQFKIVQMGGALSLGERQAFLTEDQIPKNYDTLRSGDAVWTPSNPGPLPQVLIKV